jgi:ParB family chromosome partitioning protein
MANNRGLGRGLSSLIPPRESALNVAAAEATAVSPELQGAAGTKVLDLPLDQIVPNPLQPRLTFDETALSQLAESIAQYGLLEPVVVTPAGDRWQLVAGERRFRAFQTLGKPTIPAIVRSTSELERLELALIENIQRQDLNPIEKAQAYAKLVHDFGLTQAEAAKKLGIARSSLANTVRLLDLPDEIQHALAAGTITEGHAKVLLGLPTEREQLAFFRKLASGQGSSVRALTDAVQRGNPEHRSVHDPDLANLAKQLQGDLGAKVDVKKRGRGYQLIVNVFSAEELRHVVKKIRR